MKSFIKNNNKTLNNNKISPFVDIEKGGKNELIEINEKLEEDDNEKNKKNYQRNFYKFKRKCLRIIQHVAILLEDWLFLALLGILVALCSLIMDMAIDYLQTCLVFFSNGTFLSLKLPVKILMDI
ncbi:Chloride channel protein [Meloidogyne graminicola]|uniref:Chloride channel protein n=1 Tax=Meloidogyne graminicola TaxID=189291 RepID=A0A8S9ZMX1_9BILA|nr:Chloride channel protein [Meloidogyne graminicola]